MKLGTIPQEKQDNTSSIIENNLSEYLKLQIKTTYGNHILDFNEDFLLNKENFDDIEDSTINNILSRIPAKRIFLNTAINFAQQLLSNKELELKELESYATDEAKKSIESYKKGEYVKGALSKTNINVTNNEIATYIITSSTKNTEIMEIRRLCNDLKNNITFLEQFDKIIESRMIVLLHLSKKRNNVQ